MLVFLLFASLFVALFMACVHFMATIAHGRVELYSDGWQRPDEQKARVFLFQKFHRMMAEMLLITGSKGTVNHLLSITIVLVLTGHLGGMLMFHSVKGAVFSGVMLGSLPIVVLISRFISARMRSRHDFLPAVELFYQQYITDQSFNIRIPLMHLVQRHVLPHPVHAAFERLYRGLVTKTDIDEAIRLFLKETGHVWANHFVQIIQIALLEGVDVKQSLKQLVDDMRAAQIDAESEKNRLLEIRIASFSPVLFLLLFIGVNMKMNPDNAWYFYFEQPEGRMMLMEGVGLIFLSFIMGLYLSMKR